MDLSVTATAGTDPKVTILGCTFETSALRPSLRLLLFDLFF
jgi:hypothetical protein